MTNTQPASRLSLSRIFLFFCSVISCCMLLQEVKQLYKLSLTFSTSFISLSPLSSLLMVHHSFFWDKELILICCWIKRIKWWSIRSIGVLLCFSHFSCSSLLFWEPKCFSVYVSCFLQGGDEDRVLGGESLPSHQYSQHIAFFGLKQWAVD